MNLDGYTKENRPAMDPLKFAALFGMAGCADRAVKVTVQPEMLLPLADWFEELTVAETVGLLHDVSDISADLSAPANIRVLAACVGCLCESVLTRPHAADGALIDVVYAAAKVSKPDVKVSDNGSSSS